jgi:hypothetical protein
MSRTTQSVLLIVLAVVCLALAVYYLIPGIYHPLTFSDPYISHHTHALALGVLAVLSVIAARFVRSAPTPPAAGQDRETR